MTHLTTIFFSSLFICSNVFAASVSPLPCGAISTVLNERLHLMSAVAGYKALHHLPVEDLPREQVVLSNMLNNAQQAGLEPRSVEPFVHALMNVSKAIQYRYLADWLSAPDNVMPVRDLAATRQQIQQLDTRLLTAISQCLMVGSLPDADSDGLKAQLTVPHFGAPDKSALVASLGRIQRIN